MTRTRNFAEVILRKHPELANYRRCAGVVKSGRRYSQCLRMVWHGRYCWQHRARAAVGKKKVQV